MDTSQKPHAVSTVTTPARRWKLSADQYQRMGETGIFHEDDHVELLEGELYEMSPIGSWHNSRVNWLNWRFSTGLGDRAIVQVQGSFRLSADGEPEGSAYRPVGLIEREGWVTPLAFPDLTLQMKDILG